MWRRGLEFSRLRERAQESRYLFGWGALVAALAVFGGATLLVMMDSFGTEASSSPVAGLPGHYDPGVTPSAGAPGPTATESSTPTAPPEPPKQAPGEQPPVKKPGKPSPTPEPTSGPPRPSQPPRDRHQGVNMTAPQEGQRVSGHYGFLIAGTAGDLGGRKLRIFDYADNGLWYLIDGDGVDINEGKWSLYYRNVGGPSYGGPGGYGSHGGYGGYGGHGGYSSAYGVYVMTAVLANDECQRTLQYTRPDYQGDRVFRWLPEGCDVADRVPVVKAYR